jgi:two-component system cell cycle response regulator
LKFYNTLKLNPVTGIINQSNKPGNYTEIFCLSGLGETFMVMGNSDSHSEDMDDRPAPGIDFLGIRSLENTLYGFQNKLIPNSIRALKGLKISTLENDSSLLEDQNKKLLNILLVEDNKTDATIFMQMLKDEHIFKVTHVENMKSALESLANGYFQVIILDLHLPDEEGYATFTRINEQAPDLPIIVLTGMDNEELALKIMKSGAQDYLVKGQINKDLLIRSIRYSIERYKLLEKIYSLSLIDELTGLYNRRAFLIIAERYLKLAKRNNYNMLLLFIDMDNMKKINDNYGHLEGDLAIKNTAGILKKTFRDSDMVARMGGDEFIALMLIGDLNIGFPSISNRFRDNLDKFNNKQNNFYTLSLSVGGVYWQIKKETLLDELMDKADMALYEHKKQKNDKNRDFINLFK